MRPLGAGTGILRRSWASVVGVAVILSGSGLCSAQ